MGVLHNFFGIGNSGKPPVKTTASYKEYEWNTGMGIEKKLGKLDYSYRKRIKDAIKSSKKFGSGQKMTNKSFLEFLRKEGLSYDTVQTIKKKALTNYTQEDTLTEKKKRMNIAELVYQRAKEAKGDGTEMKFASNLNRKATNKGSDVRPTSKGTGRAKSNKVASMPGITGRNDASATSHNNPYSNDRAA